MRKFLLLTVLGLRCLTGSQAQTNVGIGTSNPNSNALLDISSSTKGVLIPRTSSVTRITIPAVKGLLVYDTTTSSFWFNDGVNWTEALNANNGWGVKGNSNTNPAINFFGTGDDKPIRFRLNNTPAGQWNHSTGNYAIGYNAATNTTAGLNNVALGHQALFSNTSGSENTVMGYSAGYYNTGSYLTAIGSYSGANNTTGILNTFIGTSSGRNNSTGDNNTFLGINTGFSSNGNGNTFIGAETGKTNTSGNQNSAIGNNAFLFNTTGSNNSGLGKESLYANTSGGGNTAVGTGTLRTNTTGGENTAIGYQSAYNNNTDYMVSVGSYSGYGNTSGTWNTFIGTSSGRINSTGDNNTMVGLNSGQNSNGSNNTFIGTLSGNANLIGSNNVTLGYNAQAGAAFSNAIAIGANSSVTQSNSLALGGTGANAVKVGIGTAAPATTLEVNGYTMLGSASPRIQIKKITTTSSATAGLFIDVAHGLNPDKILSISALLEVSANVFVPDGFASSGTPGCEFYISISGTTITVKNQSGNSSQILSKPVKIFIVYEQ